MATPATNGHMSGNGVHAPEKWLLYGGTGWIGSLLIEMLTTRGKDFIVSTVRLEQRAAMESELDAVQPTHVLCAAGVTGRPNVDWCEDNKLETIRANVIGALNAADCCAMRGIHLTLYATGCIFEYNDAHPMPELQADGAWEPTRMYQEDNPEDAPNFDASFYSLTKGLLEQMLRHVPGTLVLRVRMPISDDLLNPRNFLSKICKYRRIVNIPNSMTILDDLLPISITMAERRLEGVYNFTNPGPISHHQILDLYRKHVDPEFTYEGFSVEEQAKIIKAGRSNNVLSDEKLVSALPDVHIPPVQESMPVLLQRMRAKLEAAGQYPEALPRTKI